VSYQKVAANKYYSKSILLTYTCSRSSLIDKSVASFPKYLMFIPLKKKNEKKREKQNGSQLERYLLQGSP